MCVCVNHEYVYYIAAKASLELNMYKCMIPQLVLSGFNRIYIQPRKEGPD